MTAVLEQLNTIQFIGDWIIIICDGHLTATGPADWQQPYEVRQVLTTFVTGKGPYIVSHWIDGDLTVTQLTPYDQ